MSDAVEAVAVLSRNELKANSELLLNAKGLEDTPPNAAILADVACLELSLALAASSAATDLASSKSSNLEIAYVTVVSAFAHDASKYTTVSVIVSFVYVDAATVGGDVVELKVVMLHQTKCSSHVVESAFSIIREI